jgi:hypothetical protein
MTAGRDPAPKPDDFIHWTTPAVDAERFRRAFERLSGFDAEALSIVVGQVVAHEGLVQSELDAGPDI